MSDSKRLPPLSALRIFEAAARHDNFSAAAVELHLTPGAVSRQIKTLEQHLGLALFVRDSRRHLLTRAGTQLAERVREAFGQLHEAIRQLAPEAAQRVVVTVLPSFATRWLLPRLSAFSERYPAIEIDLRPSRDIVALDRSDIDLAIRYGRGRWAGTSTSLLFEEELLPVCAPALAARFRPKAPADLLELPLIHDSDFPWLPYFDLHGVKTPRRMKGIRLDDSGLALAAAEQGQGVALGRSVLIADALQTGRLVAPIRATMKGDYSYYLAWPRQRELAPGASRFRDWLTSLPGPAPVRHGASGPRPQAQMSSARKRVAGKR